MRIDHHPGPRPDHVGPPGGPTETIPASVTVTITDTVPYDVEARLEWSPTVGKLAVRKVCCTALPGGDDVSPARHRPHRPARHHPDRPGDRVPRRHRLARTSRQAQRPRPARRRRLDLPARRRLPKPETHRHRRPRPWPVTRQRTQASPRRPQSRTAPRDRTRQTRRSVTNPELPGNGRASAVCGTRLTRNCQWSAEGVAPSFGVSIPPRSTPPVMYQKVV